MPFRANFDQVASFEWIIAGCIFGIVVVTMGFAIVRYRARPGRVANQHTEHPKIEVSYALGILAIAIFIITYTSQANARDFQPRRAAMQVKVTGFQWCWRFQYTNPSATVTGTCENGQYPTLVIPTGETIRFDVTSTDVIHAFWIPHFRYKLDAFPDHVNTFEMSVPKPGDWLGHCAEFCGMRHSDMLFHVKAVPPAAFKRWLAAAHAAGTVATQ